MSEHKPGGMGNAGALHVINEQGKPVAQLGGSQRRMLRDFLDWYLGPSYNILEEPDSWQEWRESLISRYLEQRA